MKKVLLTGEPMALLMAEENGDLAEVSHFTRSISGAEVNVAIGLKRLGFDVEYVSRLGNDPFGRYIRTTLQENGIGTRWITYDPVYRTGIQLKEKVTDGHDPDAPYYRKGSAASHIAGKDITQINLSEVALVHVTGILPALSESAGEAAGLLMRRAKEAGILLTFDPNLRPALWADEASMRKEINRLSAYADIVLPGIGECEILTGTGDKQKAADFYHSMGVKTVVIKDGKKGAFVSQALTDGVLMRMDVPGFRVNRVVDTVGAGDGFAVGFLSGLLKNLSVRECVVRANAIGAIQVQHRGDNEGLPTEEQLEQFIRSNAQIVCPQE